MSPAAGGRRGGPKGGTRAAPGARLRQINGALVELARLRADLGDDLARAFVAMTEVAARGIGVERASVWVTDPGGELLVCRDLYEVSADRHLPDEPLEVSRCPHYFTALRELRVLVAEDAFADPRCAEFKDSYLVPHRIGALLDAPIQHRGQFLGVVCLEHVGRRRRWTPEEEVFAGSVADQLSLLLQAQAQRTSERALGHSLSLLAAALESTADGILIVDRADTIRGYNQKFLDLWRLPEVLVKEGTDARLLVQVLEQLRQPEAFLQKVRELYERPGDESFDVLDFKDGRVYERYSKPQLLDGQIVGRVWSFRDVTERHLHEEESQVLQAELFQAQKIEAIGTLAGGIAHDFNNILGVILGHAAVAKAELPPEANVQDNVREILSAGERARALVDQILTFSRRRPELRQPLTLAHAIDEALRMLRASLPATIEIERDDQSDGGVVLADPTQVHQVVMNLGTNAAHAMRARGGRLSLSIRRVQVGPGGVTEPLLRPGRYLRVAVADTGHGIPPEALPHIFEPFFTTKGPREGTGLGLAVVQSILRNHEGMITVRSTPGVGTTFELYFPEVDLEAVALEPAPRPTPEGSGQHILVVDDEPQLVASAARLLEKLRYRVTGCTSAQEAIRLFQADPSAFHLLVTDLSMPKIDGLGLARELHRLRPDLPVVLTSGYFGELEPGSAAAAGIRHLLSKPYHPRTLAETVSRALGLR